MKNLIPLGVLAFGIYMLVTAQMNPDADQNLKFWAQSLGATGGGSYVLVMNNWAYIKSIFSKFFSKKTVIDDVKDPEATSLLPSSVEDRDYECAIHLRNRFLKAGNQEGLDLTKKVMDLIFTLTIPKEDKKNE